MSFFDLVVIIVCAVVGYYFVAALFKHKRTNKLPSTTSNVVAERRAPATIVGSNIGEGFSHDMGNRWYKILRVSPIATVGEIQTAYQKLAALRQSAVSVGAVQNSSQDTSEVDEAYRYIVSKYGKQHFVHSGEIKST